MKKLFAISIGYEENDENYFAVVSSLTDNKTATVLDRTARGMMAKLGKLVRKKEQQMKNFPLPEPSRIISPKANGVSKLILVGPNGRS